MAYKFHVQKTICLMDKWFNSSMASRNKGISVLRLHETVLLLRTRLLWLHP